MKTFFKILVVVCFMWITPIHAQDLLPTYDNWVDLGFGRARLISCRSTFNPELPLYLALQITPLPDYTVQPNIQAKANAHAFGTILIPFEQLYTDTFFYPLPYSINATQEPITFSVTGTVMGCKQQNCTDAPINLSLTLQPGPGLLTPQCPAITDTVTLTPIPMRANHVKGWAIKQQNQTQITLDFAQPFYILKIYSADKKQLNLSIQTQGNRATFNMPNEAAESIHFFAQTDRTIYQIDLPLLPLDTTIPPPYMSKLAWLHILIFMLLCSPWWMFVGHVTMAKRSLHKQNILALILLGLLSVGAIVSFCAWGHIPFWDTLFLTKSLTAALMFLGIIFAGFSPLVTACVSVLTPLPYMDILAQLGGAVQLGFALIYYFFFAALIYAQLRMEKSFHSFQNNKKNIYKIWWACHLPFIAWFIYYLLY